MSPNGTLHAIGILTSRIGRRFVVLFLGCALLPLLAFAWITLSRVTEQMSRDEQASLHLGAKTAGMGVAARLAQVAADLAVVAEIVQPQAVPPDAARTPQLDHVAGWCEHLWIAAGGTTTLLRGERVLSLPPWQPAERAHLRSGKPLLRALGSPPHLAMVRALEPNRDDSPLLVGVLQAQRFWEPQELRSPGAEFAVLDAAGRVLVHSFGDVPPTHELLREVAAQPSSGTIEWRVDGEEHLARYWRAFLRPQYDLDLLVVQSKSARAAREVVHAFVYWFVMTAACTLLCVLFASLVQMRRTLGPIVSLHEATRRVARGDLAVRVGIRSRDEFGELGQAFDHMTAELRENIRKRERTEQELVASRDAALAAVHAKAEFVANVSHEFRTPMTQILGAAEILAQLRDADEELREEFANMALTGARRLAKLVDDVLEIGSTNAWDMEPIELAPSLIDAVVAMPTAVRERVVSDVARGLPQVKGNSQRLTETWCRLLDNAAKFSPPGSPIEVRARHVDGEVVVEFTDRGVGISRLDLHRVFEPFQQVGRDQLTDKAQGTGLGLSLAKNAVERHGGRIEVESELGNGATFRVFLPACPAAVAAT